jgi:hypothetical protein
MIERRAFRFKSGRVSIVLIVRNPHRMIRRARERAKVARRVS